LLIDFFKSGTRKGRRWRELTRVRSGGGRGGEGEGASKSGRVERGWRGEG